MLVISIVRQSATSGGAVAIADMPSILPGFARIVSRERGGKAWFLRSEIKQEVDNHFNGKPKRRKAKVLND